MSVDDTGELPEGWTRAIIPEVCELNPAKPKTMDHANDLPVTFVPMPSVDADAGAITKPSLRPFSEVRKGFTSFRDGDVILAKITPCMENGKAAVARGLTNGLGFGSTEFHVFRSNGAVLPDYLFYFIRQESFRKAAEKEMTGSVGQKRVPAEYLEQVELPLPPLAEQRRIVAAIEAVLAKVNTARERLNRVLLILKRFRQAVLSAACSGRLTADWREKHGIADEPTENEDGIGYPDSWSCKLTADLVEPGTAISYGIVLPGPNLQEGVPYIRGLDIDDAGRIQVHQLFRTSAEIAAKHKRSAVREGDVLLCVIRHLRVAIVPPGIDGANLTQGTVRLRPSREVLGPYLAYYLSSPQAQGWMKSRYVGTDMPRINVEHARTIPVPVPPMAEQQESVRRVGELFARADVIEERLADARRMADQLTQAVLAKAFRGELVPTEAELARRENRTYEPAADLLARIRAARQQSGPSANDKPRRSRKTKPDPA